MRSKDVCAVLRDLDLGFSQRPGQITLTDGPTLCTGGGIAGNMRVWWFRLLSSERPEGPLKTKVALRRCLLGWLAGPRPPERDGYALYARLNHNRFGDAYIWVHRRTGT